MDVKQQNSQKGHIGAIITWIIIALIIIIGGGLLYLNLSKPSPKDALTTAAKTKINSTRATIVIKQSKKSSETLNYELKGNTIHLSNHLVPENKNQEQETWITNDKFYFLNNKKWNYMERTPVTNAFINNSADTYKRLFTGHDFDKLSTSALGQFKVHLDGLNGYRITYKGNNKNVIQDMQKVISGDNQNDNSQIKNIDVTINTNRQKKLTGYKIYYTFKNGKSTTSMQLDDVNKINSLSLPKEVKAAQKIATPNIR